MSWIACDLSALMKMSSLRYLTERESSTEHGNHVGSATPGARKWCWSTGSLYPSSYAGTLFAGACGFPSSPNTRPCPFGCGWVFEGRPQDTVSSWNACDDFKQRLSMHRSKSSPPPRPAKPIIYRRCHISIPVQRLCYLNRNGRHSFNLSY